MSLNDLICKMGIAHKVFVKTKDVFEIDVNIVNHVANLNKIASTNPRWLDKAARGVRSMDMDQPRLQSFQHMPGLTDTESSAVKKNNSNNYK